MRFEVATAKDFPGEGYDLVCRFDCLHDMGDPVGAAAHVRRRLADVTRFRRATETPFNLVLEARK